MAKKKKESEWTDPSAIEAFMATQVAASAAGRGLMTSAEGAASDIGIRLPYFCLRYLFNRTTFPFERTAILYGPPGSNKSSLLFWIYRLFRDGAGQFAPHGKYIHLGLEDKDSPWLRLSLLNQDNNAGWTRECQSMDEFQGMVQAQLSWFMEQCSKGPGRRIPLVFGIDSLVAKMTQSAQENVRKAGGVTGRRFADEARSLSDWFKYVPGLLRGWPISLVGINHDKPKPIEGRPGMMQHVAPGGSAPVFYATYKILMTKIGRVPAVSSGWQGNRIKLLMDKNSLGTDHLSIETDFMWRAGLQLNANGEKVRVQESAWNWPKATMDLFNRILTSKNQNPVHVKAIKDILGLQKVTGGRYTASGLGVTKDDPLSAYDMGELLETKLDILSALEDRFGIGRGREFQVGVDYEEQLASAKSEAELAIPAYNADRIDFDGQVIQTSAAAQAAAETDGTEYEEEEDEADE